MSDMMEQGTDEWRKARLGRVTASRIADVMAKGRSGAPSATRSRYLAEIVAERLTGCEGPGFTSAAIAWGTETEPQARAAYRWRTGEDVAEIGFAQHPAIISSGASPDGLVGEDGLLEIKCPETHTHIGYLTSGTIPAKYVDQMQWQMACTGRRWCDFVSFDPRLPPDRGAFFCKRVERDENRIQEIEEAVRVFLADVEASIAEIDTATGFISADDLPGVRSGADALLAG